MQRMRWSNTGAELIRTQARDGAHLRSIDEPAPPRRRDIHIYLPGAKVADQAAQPTGGLPPASMDQNVEPPAAGFRDRGMRLRATTDSGVLDRTSQSLVTSSRPPFTARSASSS